MWSLIASKDKGQCRWVDKEG